MEHLREAWQRRIAGARIGALSLEDQISVAEQTIERAGQQGPLIVIPRGSLFDDTPGLAEVRSMIERWAADAGYNHPINVMSAGSSLDGAQALVDQSRNPVAMQLRSPASQMTILHEIAHLVHGSSEGEGHDSRFVGILRQLYRKHLGSEAASIFDEMLPKSIVGVRSRIAAAETTVWRGYSINIYAKDNNWYQKAREAFADPSKAHAFQLAFLRAVLLGKVNDGNGESSGAGVHWTTRKEWAFQIKGLDQSSTRIWNLGCTIGLAVEGQYDPADVADHKGRHDYNSMGADVEAEVLLKPGSTVKITNAWMQWPSTPQPLGGDLGWGNTVDTVLVNLLTSFTVKASTSTWYHWSGSGTLSSGWVHAGTRQAAQDRKSAFSDSMNGGSDHDGSPRMLSLSLIGPSLNTAQTPIHDRMVDAITQGGSITPELWHKNWKYMMPKSTTESQMQPWLDVMDSVVSKLRSGQRGAIFYVNDAEDPGSISVVAPRECWAVS